MSGNNQAHSGSPAPLPPLVMHIDVRRLTMSPIKLEIHDLLDESTFDNEDSILKQVRDILVAARKRPTPT